MRWRAALLGLAMVAVPGAVGASALHSTEPVTWPRTPTGGPVVHTEPPARWDVPARASLALLRRVTAAEARRSVAALVTCETRATRAASAKRIHAFRRCATMPLARTDAFASANSRMLSDLAGSAGPTEACRGRVLSLSGLTGTLGFSARTTLRGWGVPWRELLASSRAVRAVAREASKLARAPGW